MKPLYSPKQFTAAKSNDELPMQCEQCCSKFVKSKHRIQDCLNVNRHETGDFCSPRCQNLAQAEPIMITCANCDTTSSRRRSDMTSKSGNYFCSKSCAATWNNTHKHHGTRRSKLEWWLAEQLQETYSSIIFHFNRKDTIGSELDIMIPELQLAFELNGVFHYKPIFGQKKLEAIQANDRIKIKACHTASIELVSLDVTEMRNFKKQLASKFLLQITNRIDAKTESVGFELTGPEGPAA